jgi:hypothetical protein
MQLENLVQQYRAMVGCPSDDQFIPYGDDGVLWLRGDGGCLLEAPELVAGLLEFVKRQAE